MSTRRHSRHSYTPFHAPPHIILRCGQPRRPLTVTSVKDFCGVLLARACAVLSVGSNVMRSAKIYSTPIVFRVRKMCERITYAAAPKAWIRDQLKTLSCSSSSIQLNDGETASLDLSKGYKHRASQIYTY